jgi:hypothetical protein
MKRNQEAGRGNLPARGALPPAGPMIESARTYDYAIPAKASAGCRGDILTRGIRANVPKWRAFPEKRVHFA